MREIRIFTGGRVVRSRLTSEPRAITNHKIGSKAELRVKTLMALTYLSQVSLAT